jgi:hypothetical protein
LNFGPAGVPLAFLLLGMTVGYVRRAFAKAGPEDVAWLLFPLFAGVLTAGLIADFDNLVVVVLSRGIAPCVAVALAVAAARRHERRMPRAIHPPIGRRSE